MPKEQLGEFISDIIHVLPVRSNVRASQGGRDNEWEYKECSSASFTVAQIARPGKTRRSKLSKKAEKVGKCRPRAGSWSYSSGSKAPLLSLHFLEQQQLRTVCHSSQTPSQLLLLSTSHSILQGRARGNTRLLIL